MTALTIAILCGVVFVVFSIATVAMQVRKMQKLVHSHPKDGVNQMFDGLMPIALGGMLATFGLIGTVISLLFHFLG